MRPPLFQDWRLFIIVVFFLTQLAFCIEDYSEGGTHAIVPSIVTILWLIASLFVWHRQMFAGRIKIIASSMLLAPLLLLIELAISQINNYRDDFIFSLCIDYYPIMYSIFNFLYGKIRRIHFSLFESFLLFIICIPILPIIMGMYIYIGISIGI